nr:conserved hypothetical protein [Hymenolepis microstoma]
MQRPPSFVLLDHDSSSSEPEEFVNYSSNVFEEGLTFNTSSALNNGQSKSYSPSKETTFPKLTTKSSTGDQDSCLPSADECADITSITTNRSRNNSDVSNKSGLSPEEVVLDPIRSSDECESRSDSKIDETSYSNDDSLTELLVSLPPTELEVAHNSTPETEPAIGRIEESNIPTEVKTVCNPDVSVFNHFVNIVVNIGEAVDQIGSIWKWIALCVLLLAILISAATVSTFFQISSTTTTIPHVFDLETSELVKCRATLNWRQEKTEQLETKLGKLKTRVEELQNGFGDCRTTLSDYLERNTKCGNALKETKKMLKLKEEQYENVRNKVLQLQEKIISSQQEEVSDHRPFLQKAFDKIFGFPHGRKFRDRRSKWRH